MNYYLLTFNEDWADEHNVPALACFTEEEYNRWLEEPAGKPNPKYEEIKEQVHGTDKQWEKFWKDLEDNGFTLDGHANTEQIPKGHPLQEELKRLRAIPHTYRRSAPRIFSYMSASLGNSGEAFSEDYSEYAFNREYTEGERPLVRVTEVDKAFYDVFHKASLSRLSLCNIFNFDKASDYYEEEEG